MKVSYKNFSGEMFALFTKDKIKQRMGLPLAQGKFKWEFKETFVPENVGTWEYFNKGIHSAYFWIVEGKLRSTLELKSDLDDFFWFDFAC